ncbi:MAG TPA: hypothetical protein ENI87_12235, partial [bacterium]|nr:hypothetical protein [bacterium]
MSTTSISFLGTALLTAMLAAQDAHHAPPKLLAGFDVHAGTLQSLAIQRDDAGNYLIPVRLGQKPRTMALRPHDIRSPNFRLLVRDAAGIHTAPTPECITYRGHLVEEPQVRVAASIVDGSIDAIIHRPTGPNAPLGDNWVVQPANRVQPNAGPALHVVYRAADTVPLPYHCGNGTPAISSAPPSPTGTDNTRYCEIAIEADTEFYQQNGSSVTQTQNDITTVMNQVDFIYDRDVDVQFQVVSILVTTVGVYTTNNPGNLLSQFRNNWLNTHANIARDVTHLFTGRNLSGSVIGIAYLSGVCTADGYGLSQSR